MAIFAFAGDGNSKTVIVAHRGYWDCEAAGHSQNSLAALKAAGDQGFWGSELDIHFTSDSCILVNHDNSINGKAIVSNPLSAFENDLLPNGEKRPTFEEYLEVAKSYPSLHLVVEFKPKTNTALVDKAVEALRSFGLMDPDKVSFIAFGYKICQHIAKNYPEYSNQYLNGDKSPKELAADGINGLDYNYRVLKAHPDWVAQAHQLGLYVNSWTVNDEADIKAMLSLGVDAITTNRPEEVRAIIEAL